MAVGSQATSLQHSGAPRVLSPWFSTGQREMVRDTWCWSRPTTLENKLRELPDSWLGAGEDNTSVQVQISSGRRSKESRGRRLHRSGCLSATSAIELPWEEEALHGAGEFLGGGHVARSRDMKVLNAAWLREHVASGPTTPSSVTRDDSTQGGRSNLPGSGAP